MYLLDFQIIHVQYCLKKFLRDIELVRHDGLVFLFGWLDKFDFLELEVNVYTAILYRST